MNKITALVLWFVFIFAPACNPGRQDSKLYFSNSVESAFAWQDHSSQGITWSDQAHSGNYVCKMDSATPYSVTFNMKLSDISRKPLKSVRISAWVNMSSMVSDPVIAVDIRDSNFTSMEWISRPAKDFVAQPNHWEQIDFKVNLREKNRNRKSNYLRIYLSNAHRDYTLADDIEISFEEQ